ncbi:MAG TPA: carbohydrate-binding protein, partial [Polyangiaceae bacterium]
AGTGSGGMDAGCTPESDSSLCSRLRKDCGPISGVDNCGTTRNVSSCGSCTSPKICGAGGTVNVCALYAGTPYGGTPVSIGGTASTWYTVEAEEYDVGGEGISYHDTTSTNTLGGLRTGANEGVDIEAACGSSGGCYDIGAIAPGEWTKYAINVVTSGAYMVQLGAASATSKNMHIEVDTRNVTGSLAVNTGGSTTFRSISPTVSFSMSSGPHVVTFAFDDGSMALNWVKFQRQ